MFKEKFTESKKPELQEAINVVKHLNDFNFYTTKSEKNGNTVIEIVSTNGVKRVITFTPSGKNRITVITPGHEDDTYVINFRTTSVFSGVIEFAKYFAKMTKNKKDYEIIQTLVEKHFLHNQK